MSKHTSTQKWRAAPVAKPAYFAEMPFGWKTLLWILPFFLLAVFSADTGILRANIVLGIAVIVLFATLGRHMDTRLLNLQTLFVFLYALMGGISCFYASARSLGLQEFVKIFFSLCIYFLFLLLSGHGQSAGRNAATALSVSAAIWSFLSIDLISTRWFSGLFRAFTGLFTASYTQSEGLEAGTRITSILEDPNVFAGVAGIGVLLALGLALSSRGRERILHLICLAVSALGFLLVFSLGATGFIAVAFLAFLLFLPRASRPGALLLMIETLVVTAIGAFVCYSCVFSGTKSFSLVPLACLILNSAAVCLLDRFLGARLEVTFKGRAPLAGKILIGLVIAAAVYLAAGFCVTGSLHLSAGESINRAAYLSSGSYTVSSRSASAVQVSVTSQSAEQLIMHTSTDLYSGSAEKFSFKVPKGAKVVWFAFSSKKDSVLSSCAYHGSESGSLKLGYPLLPGFVANRLQGLRTNQNAIQRVEFWHDSLQLWKGSPIFGRGLGSLEAGLFSVASFYYQTKYAHNHYIQMLTDTGIVGLAIFLGLLFFSARLLFQARRKEEKSALLPCLSASLLFLILQAAIQVDFSSHSFLPFAFGVFALINVCSISTENVTVTEKTDLPSLSFKKLGKYSSFCIGIMAFSAVWIVLFSGHLIGASTARDESENFFDRMESAMKTDAFDQYSYKISYLSQAKSSKDAHVRAVAEKYAASLIRNPGNFDPAYGAEYYFARKEYSKAFDSLENHVRFNRVRPTLWTYTFTLLATNDDDSAAFRSGAKKIVQEYHSWQKQSLDKIKLSKEARTYLASIE